MSKPAPEDFIPEFRRKKLDEDGFLKNYRPLCRSLRAHLPCASCMPFIFCLKNLPHPTRKNHYFGRAGLFFQPHRQHS